MVFEYNPIAVLNSEELSIVEYDKKKLRELKVQAYGEESNLYNGEHVYEPTGMGKKELVSKILDVFPEDKIKRFSESHQLLREKSDYLMAKTVIEDILPKFWEPKTLIDYDFYIVGRDSRQIDNKDGSRGRADTDNHYPHIFTLDELIDSWKEIIFLDERVYREGIEHYMPEGTDCLLSTVHKLYAVKRTEYNKRKKWSKNQNNGFAEKCVSDDKQDLIEIDLRNKSGSDYAYKVVHYLSGLEYEDKPPYTKEDILDSFASRMMFNKNFEQNVINFYESFMRNYKGSCKGSLILQILGSNHKESEKEFLSNIKSAKERGFCKRAITTEDRSNIFSVNELENLSKGYYIEMLRPFCTMSDDNGCFGKNISDILCYPLDVFKKIHEKHDDFLYKGRRDDWRDEHWSFFEWALLEIIRHYLGRQSAQYVGLVTKSKLKKDLALF